MSIKIPCAYQGGKQRIAKDIVDIILSENQINDSTKFYDLCCGSGAISVELINRGFDPYNIVMVDKSPWGLFWKKIGEGDFSMDVFKLYIDIIPKNKSEIKPFMQEMLTRSANDGKFNTMVYKFLILQAAAFGSSATWVENDRWKKAGGLRNYWEPTATSNRRSPVNPMMPMPETLYNRVEKLTIEAEGVNGFYSDVTDIKIEPGAIVYIDPPYENTSHYGYQLSYMEFIKSLPMHTVYLSEGKPIGDKSYKISGKRNKGGINGSSTNKNEEWLNVFLRKSTFYWKE